MEPENVLKGELLGLSEVTVGIRTRAGDVAQ